MPSKTCGGTDDPQKTLEPPPDTKNQRQLRLYRTSLPGLDQALTPEELLLYFFLVLAADEQGLSYYSKETIGSRLKLSPDQYGQALNGLIMPGPGGFSGAFLPGPVVAGKEAVMIDRRTVFEIHRLFHEGYGIRKIARTLKLSRDTVKRYLDNPNPAKPLIVRSSKLDPFKEEIQRLLQRDPTVSGSVLYQRLIPQGYAGGISILREYLQKIRPREKRAYLRFESALGEQFQVDWGHFGSLLYGKTPRKLYCLAVIEAHSRMLYGEFTHSQNQATLHQALLNAFLFFEGTCRRDGRR